MCVGSRDIFILRESVDRMKQADFFFAAAAAAIAVVGVSWCVVWRNDLP